MTDFTQSTAEKPDIPEEMQDRWQRVLNLMARTIGVPAGAVMKADPPQIQVFLATEGEGTPFRRGDRLELKSDLYCERVIREKAPLQVSDALEDPEWKDSPMIGMGMTYYLGFPLLWPDGEIFGSICVFDRKDNPQATRFCEWVSQIRQLIEKDLHTLIRIDAREELLGELQRHQDHLRETVEERTADLAKSERVLAEAQRVAQVGSWEWDIRSGTHRWSDEVYRIFGLLPQKLEASYERFLSLVHPEDRRRVDQANQESISDLHKPYSTEYRVVQPDGTERSVHARADVLFDESRRAVRMIGTMQDITERRQWEQALHEREEHFRLLHQTMLHGVVYHDGDGKVISMNPAAERILGRGLAGFVGAFPDDFEHRIITEDRSPFPVSEYPVTITLRTGREQHGTVMGVYNPAVGDYRWISVSAVPLFRPGEGKPYQVYTLFDDITERKLVEEALKKAFDEIKALKEKLEAENLYLREETGLGEGFPNIIGASDSMRYVLFRVKQVAPTKATVLLTGETGTGKGVFARAIHEESNRKNKTFVHVNCAGLPPNLIESELFGREKGAFTGATQRQIGRFDLANGGTIFLDEIGELPLDLQAKLLKVIESGEFERLGSPRTVTVDVRIIASTNRDLEDDIKMGRFRKDLFYRLNVYPITIPPLRQRRADIPLLARFFIDKFSTSHGKRITKVPERVMDALQAYAWPGNVRELINVIERSVILSGGPVFQLAEKIGTVPLVQQGEAAKAEKKTGAKGLSEVEREHILRVLQETGWRIEGPRGTAHLLEMNPSTLRARMKKLGIRRPKSH